MTEDLSWLEGGEVASAPTYTNMTKRELCAALDYSPAKLDRLIRLGLPGRKGANNASGYRFTLAEVVEWIAQHRVAEQGGGDDNSIAAAKRRLAIAQAHAKELENERNEGEVIEVEIVRQWIMDAYTRVRTRFESLETEIPGLSEKHQFALRDSIHSALTDVSEEAAAGALKLEQEEEAEELPSP